MTMGTYRISTTFEYSTNTTRTEYSAHVDGLFITSISEEIIEELAVGLIVMYGDVTKKNGPILNYLGTVFNITVPGESTVTMGGYVEDMLREIGTTGGARTPATEGLLEVREMASESDRVEIHRCVAKMLYMATRCRPNCLTTVSYLATRVNRCTSDDLLKLRRLMKYVHATKDRGIVIKAGEGGITVMVRY